MFGRTEVNKVMDWLEKNVPFFASEAQLQMSFIVRAMQLDNEKRYVFIPEYPIKRISFNGRPCDKRDEIDLAIIDTKELDAEGKPKKTFIEFKHKTLNSEKTPFKVPLTFKGIVIEKVYEPTNMGAVDLGSYDCWSDIERLEYYKKEKKCQEAFFIFITNDQRYWNPTVTERTHKYTGFSIADGDRGAAIRKWTYTNTGDLVTGTISEKHSLGAGRIEHTPLTTNNYETDSNGKKIAFEKFGEPVVYYGSVGSVGFTQYKKLVLEIK